MNPFQAFLAGIAPEHAPALVAGLTTAGWLGMAAARGRGAMTDRWAAVLLGVSAAVHLALPLHPHHGPLLNVAFVASAAAYGLLARSALRGGRWQAPAALLALATLVGYLVSVGSGEEADQVGVATALVELTLLGLALVPGPRPGRPRRLARFAGGAATGAAVLLTGAIVWALSFVAHQHHEEPQQTGGHGHEHEHTGRTQAGVIMRPPTGEHHPTEEQRQAADALAARTAQAIARYADLDAAIADGYRAALGMRGTDVHLEHSGHKSDGVTLDPQRPEMLVYAVEGGRASLLGVVYVMEVAGRPGPEPGGPITRWHAHNLCVSVLPPGLGVVSPFGGCPAFAVGFTTPEMMHVWVVDNPRGAFAESLDEARVRDHNARHGRPTPGR